MLLKSASGEWRGRHFELRTCLASHKSSVVRFVLFIAFSSQYFVGLWLFVNKFCLEIVVAYCWYMSGLGFQKEIFLFFYQLI